MLYCGACSTWRAETLTHEYKPLISSQLCVFFCIWSRCLPPVYWSVSSNISVFPCTRHRISYLYLLTPWIQTNQDPGLKLVLHPQRRSLVSETLTLTRARRFLRERKTDAPKTETTSENNGGSRMFNCFISSTSLVRYQIYTSSQQNTLRTVLPTVS